MPKAAVTGEGTAREPYELGEANKYIEARPGLRALRNVGAAVLTGEVISKATQGSALDIKQTGAWAGAGQAVVEAADKE